jgi:hypothetical protein
MDLIDLINNKGMDMTTKKVENNVESSIKKLEKITIKNPSSSEQSTIDQWDKFFSLVDEISHIILSTPATK